MSSLKKPDHVVAHVATPTNYKPQHPLYELERTTVAATDHLDNYVEFIPFEHAEPKGGFANTRVRGGFPTGHNKIRQTNKIRQKIQRTQRRIERAAKKAKAAKAAKAKANKAIKQKDFCRRKLNSRIKKLEGKIKKKTTRLMNLNVENYSTKAIKKAINEKILKLKEEIKQLRTLIDAGTPCRGLEGED
jgi:hypothetical protein